MYVYSTVFHAITLLRYDNAKLQLLQRFMHSLNLQNNYLNSRKNITLTNLKSHSGKYTTEYVNFDEIYE